MGSKEKHRRAMRMWENSKGSSDKKRERQSKVKKKCKFTKKEVSFG